MRETQIEQYSSDPDNLDEYYGSTRLEARFDPLTIQLLVVEAIPKHAAYGMMLDEYQKQRSRFSAYDDTEKKRLSFYFPSFYGRIAGDMAIIHDVSQYRFLTLLTEIGLITFQYDYHDDYSEVRGCRKELVSCITSDTNRDLYTQLERHTLDLCSSVGARMGKAKHFVPTVPEWLYNAITDTATNLNMSTSDFIYLCWCIGVVNALPESSIPEFVGKDINDIIKRFGRELKEYSYQVSNTLERMKINKGYTTTL
jgi:hypothetical protein